MRKYKRKTTRAERTAETIKNAVQAHLVDRKSLAETAQLFNIPVRSLTRYCRKARNTTSAPATAATQAPTVVPARAANFRVYPNPGQVLNSEQEFLHAKYLVKAADIYFGLSRNEVRKFALQYAITNNVTLPESWERKMKAGEDWFRYFMARHPSLPLRKPQATSLARATSFNKTNVNKFFTLLKTLLEKHGFDAQDIYNMDETGITTVQSPDRVVARKGFKQIGRITH